MVILVMLAIGVKLSASTRNRARRVSAVSSQPSSSASAGKPSRVGVGSSSATDPASTESKKSAAGKVKLGLVTMVTRASWGLVIRARASMLTRVRSLRSWELRITPTALAEATFMAAPVSRDRTPDTFPTSLCISCASITSKIRSTSRFSPSENDISKTTAASLLIFWDLLVGRIDVEVETSLARVPVAAAAVSCTRLSVIPSRSGVGTTPPTASIHPSTVCAVACVADTAPTFAAWPTAVTAFLTDSAPETTCCWKSWRWVAPRHLLTTLAAAAACCQAGASRLKETWSIFSTWRYACEIKGRAIPWDASTPASALVQACSCRSTNPGGALKSSAATGTTATFLNTALAISPAHHMRLRVWLVSRMTSAWVWCCTTWKIFSKSSRESESRKTSPLIQLDTSILNHRARIPPPPLWWHRNTANLFFWNSLSWAILTNGSTNAQHTTITATTTGQETSDSW
mmetsp:Transcript_26924/g.60770  ORF Transcript_26924/g.60770 Transcript_26924/m.60770 type:complete len:460 (-) Transcript_26924:134-1513(-)